MGIKRRKLADVVALLPAIVMRDVPKYSVAIEMTSIRRMAVYEVSVQ